MCRIENVVWTYAVPEWFGQHDSVQGSLNATHIVCIKLESLVRSQNDESFCLQYRHSPQAIWKETTTR